MSDSSNQFRFTKASLSALKPKDQRYQVNDTEVKGLALSIYPSGVKTFFRVGRVHGSYKRVKIGPFPDLTVSNARDKCQSINGNLADGKAPNAPQRGGLSFRDLWDQYLHEYAEIEKKPNSVKHDRWQWKSILEPAWGNRKAQGIKKPDVLNLQTRLARERGKPTANRALSLISKIFNHAIDRDRVEANPAKAVKKFKEKSRKRFAQADELPRLFKALDEFDNQDIADFWRVSLWTGARQSKVLSMAWKDIDFTLQVWTIPDGKGEDAQRVPLMPQVLELLEARRNRSKFVFPSHGKSGHLTRPGKAWERLLESARFDERLTMHDLRRTLGSYQAISGTSELIIGSALGHAAGSRATSVYARLNDAPIRDAMNLAVDKMEALGKSKEDDQ